MDRKDLDELLEKNFSNVNSWLNFAEAKNAANIAFVIALSLIVTVILSKLIGCILPLVANQIGLDPAIMASPLITTIVDTCSILVYFNIAVHIFNL